MTKLLVIVALILSTATASAQTVTRFEKNRTVTTEADGAVTTSTSRRANGVHTITTERVEAPGRRLAEFNRDLPPQRASDRRDGTWTGHEGSARDVAWMEACRPTFKTDEHGMTRYVYAKRGCETGDPQ